MAIHNDGGDDSEDDDDIVIGVGENFRKHIDALKRACVLEVGHGGYISTPASILSGETTPACEEDDEEEEDDDELFLSIKSKYGSFAYGDSPWLGKRTSREKKVDTVASTPEEDDEEEDDEEILRSVEQLYRSGGGSGQLSILPKPASPRKDSSGARDDAPRDDEETHPRSSPHASPGFEPGGHGDEEDGGFSPQTRSEKSVEPVEEVGRSIASFLPGNWIDTDGDVEYSDPGPAGPLEMVSIEHRGSNLSPPPEETKTYSNPETAHILTDALKKNRECQRTLRCVLSQVEAKQKENAELQKRVRSLVDFEKYCNRRFAGFFTDQANPSVKLIAAKAPASLIRSSDTSNKTDSDVQTCGPPENLDVEIYKKLKKKISFTFPTRRWSNEERIELAKGVKQQVYEVLVVKAMDTLSNADALDEEFNSLDEHMSKIGGKEFTPQQIRDAVPGIDWAEVARLYVVGRTPEECRTRWINHEDTLINKRAWSKLEDKKLLSIAQQHNFCTWETIAEQLGTNRTPAECLIRYQRSLNASIMRSNWTPEEDSRLRAAVEVWGENDWSAVAACLEGRNNSQCLMRWYKVLHPTKKKRGRWSVEEDKRLKWAVSVYGPKKWKQIAEHVPGRTDLQCRERWCNVLDPSIKLGEWTEDEDRLLEESVARHGPHRWAAVANDLKIRTDNQCCRRWKFLHPEDQPEFQRTLHIRRTALVGNFQGRKKERPRLGPQDFISNRTDFEMFARKPAGKKIVKRKEFTQKSGGDNTVQSMAVDGPRERRAARILKRKLARAKKAGSNHRAGISVSTRDAQIENELMDGRNNPDNAVRELRAGVVNTELGHIERLKRKAAQISDPTDLYNRSTKRTKWKAASAVSDLMPGPRSNRSDKGTKRKAVQMADPIEPLKKRTKLQVSRSNRSLSVSHSQDTSTREEQSVGPEIFSFLDLVQSVESYCKYSCLLAKEENRLERSSHASETQEPELAGGDQIDRDLESTTDLDPRLGEARDKDSCQRGMNPVYPGNGQFSREDEEVASATRAVLSWPFAQGVQELWSQGTTYLGSLGGTDLGPQGLTNLSSPGGTNVSSPGVTNLESQGTKTLVSEGKKDSMSKGRPHLGSHGTTDLGSPGLTELGPQGTTDLGSRLTELGPQGTTDSGSPGLTELGPQGTIDLGSQGKTHPWSLESMHSGSQETKKDADSQRKTHSWSLERMCPGSQGTKDSGSEGKTHSVSQGRTDLGSPGLTKLGCQGNTGLGSHGVSDWSSQGRTDLKSQQATHFVSEGRTDLGSEVSTDLGSMVSKDLGSEGITDLRSKRRTDVGSQRTTHLDSQGQADLSNQVRTEVGSQVSSKNAEKIETTKGDSGSIPSAAVKKPRSKRTVKMRGAVTWEKSDKLSVAAPILRPRVSARKRR